MIRQHFFDESPDISFESTPGNVIKLQFQELIGAGEVKEIMISTQQSHFVG
jgi:hypothetical protein